ncbi:hypothetical protein SMA679_0256 [Streptococcus macedonicus]|nr:hypothetical protein SMA679_0256 [Streptococcus macedonicus]
MFFITFDTILSFYLIISRLLSFAFIFCKICLFKGEIILENTKKPLGKIQEAFS